MFECWQHSPLDPRHERWAEQIQLYKLPLVYQKSPQALFRELSREKIKPGSRPKRELGRIEEVCWEALSPSETVGKFEGIISKLGRSAQVIRELRRSEVVRDFLRRVQF